MRNPNRSVIRNRVYASTRDRNSRLGLGNVLSARETQATTIKLCSYHCAAWPAKLNWKELTSSA